MSADKRSVTTDALATLGTIIESGGRDAIHLAVEPIVAAEKLWPGQDIGIVDGKASSRAEKKLGIVDPFVRPFVPEGSMFWLIVYPRQITSLRHVWEHPDFKEKNPWGEITNVELPPLTEKQISEAWINDFADRIHQHPISLMNAAQRWVDSEDYTYDNSEGYKKYYDEFPEFWKHFEIVTGQKPREAESFFTCSC